MRTRAWTPDEAADGEAPPQMESEEQNVGRDNVEQRQAARCSRRTDVGLHPVVMALAATAATGQQRDQKQVMTKRSASTGFRFGAPGGPDLDTGGCNTG